MREEIVDEFFDVRAGHGGFLFAQLGPMHVRHHPIIFGPHVLEKPFAEKFLADGPFDIHFGASRCVQFRS